MNQAGSTSTEENWIVGIRKVDPKRSRLKGALLALFRAKRPVPFHWQKDKKGGGDHKPTKRLVKQTFCFRAFFPGFW
jgi:hypothetical protein